jgi:hypothetical protein
MNIIKDVFSQAYESSQGRRQPKCRLFPPGSRLIRIRAV